MNREELKAAILAAGKAAAAKATPVTAFGVAGASLITMTGRQRDAWEQSIYDQAAGKVIDNITAHLVAATLVDDSRQPLFTPAEVDALGESSGAELDRLYRIAAKLNAIGAEARAEFEKNSGGPAMPGPSIATSPASSAA